MAISNPKAVSAKLEQFYDATLSRRLKESGFLKRLSALILIGSGNEG
jgi:hypothetical protein